MKHIPLTRGHSVAVDDEDFAQLSCRLWRAQVTGTGKVYAHTHMGGKSVPMQTLLMGPVPEGYRVTFADGNSLNCTRMNLVIRSRTGSGGRQGRASACGPGGRLRQARHETG
jgi:hypothetical protein